MATRVAQSPPWFVHRCCRAKRRTTSKPEAKMAPEREYIAVNNAERERLRALIDRLSDAELSRPMAAGWTISATLAHMGFWDARVLYLLDKWERGSGPSAADIEPEDIDWVNDSAKPLCLALPPREAARLAL